MSVTLSALGICGMVISFLLLVFALVALNRPLPLDDAITDKRKRTLFEVRNWHEELLTTYGWVDRSAEVVRIPIERAMELTIKDLKEGKGIASAE